MAVRSNTYYGRYATTFISDALLSNVVILGVKRHGVGYAKKDTLPVDDEMKFWHDQANGKIHFSISQPFGFDTNDNDVFVLWKE